MGKKGKREETKKESSESKFVQVQPNTVTTVEEEAACTPSVETLRRWCGYLEKAAELRGEAFHDAPPLPEVPPKNCEPIVLANDLKRCLWHVLPKSLTGGDKDKEEALREHERRRLRVAVIRSLVGSDTCFYYQGLHEVLSVVTLCTLGNTGPEEAREEVAATAGGGGGGVAKLQSARLLPTTEEGEMVAKVCRGLVQNHLVQFCTKSMDATEEMLTGMHEVLCQETGHGKLVQLLEASGVAPDTHYALSWLITWFSHSIDDMDILREVYDHLLQGDSYRMLFLCAALVLSNEKKILSEIFAPFGDQLGPDEFGMIYSMMGKIPTSFGAFKGEGGAGSSRAKVKELCAFSTRLESKWKKHALIRIKQEHQVRLDNKAHSEATKRSVAQRNAAGGKTAGDDDDDALTVQTNTPPVAGGAAAGNRPATPLENLSYLTATLIFVAASVYSWGDPNVRW